MASLASPGVALVVAETQVFNARMAGPAAWQDLDLSGVVGAQKTLVLLKATCEGARSFAVRKNGDTDESYDNTPLTLYGKGAGTSDLRAGVHTFFEVATDTAGKIEICGENTTGNFTLDIIAYIK